MTQDASSPALRAFGPVRGLLLNYFLVLKEYTASYGSWYGSRNVNFYSDPTKLQGNRVMTEFGGQTIPVIQTWLRLGLGHLPPLGYKLSVAPVSEYILGIDILWGVTLQITVGEFRLRERYISIWMVQVILRGHVKHELFACLIHAGLLILNSIDSWGQEESSGMVKKLEEAGIIGLAHRPYNSPIWTVQRSAHRKAMDLQRVK